MLPNLTILAQIPQQILKISNRQGEYKRPIHYGLFLLCHEAGLRVSEAINFDLSAKNKHGLYKITKTKGQKERLVYIPKKVINELKKHHWKPNHTNRFNFYHFLKKIKRELSINQNVELSPHTLRRAFATYQAEAGLPLPLLSKLLGHSSIRTTALYWMNIYHGGDDDNDIDSILAGKFWLEKPPWKLKPESAAPVNLNLEGLPELLVPNSLASRPHSNYLNKIRQLEEQLSQIQQEKNKEITRLKNELSQANKQKEALQNDLANLSEQNTFLCQERHQAQQELTTAKLTISRLTQELAQEKEKRKAAENNLLAEQNKNQSLQKINTDLANKIYAYEQNYINLQNTYQIILKDKENAEMLIHSEKQKADHYEQQLKSIVQTLYQWQKLNYYKQLEQEKNEFRAQIIQPPPWR